MEFINVIEERRSIRKYKNGQIKKEDLDYIFNSARLAPSAHNRQPWQYLVFTGEQKRKLEKLISEYITIKQELTYHEKIMRNCLKFIIDAPVFTLVYSNLEENTLNDYISLGASIEHICLSAKNIGIGSLWLGVILDFEDLIAKNYDVKGMKLISAVILGYPDEEPSERPRKELEEIVEYI